LDGERFGPLPIKPVEAPHLVRAVLGTKSGTDTPVIDLIVQALFGMVRCKYGTNRFAGGIVAVLAEHGKKKNFFHVLWIMVALYPEPGHFPLLKDPLEADNTDIVFRVTGDRASFTTNASVQIHHHGPTIIFMLMRRVEIPFRIVSFRNRKGEWEFMHG
jgi:hypothetical protein